MLTLQGLTSLINDESRRVQDEINKHRDVYYGMSLHIDGACPMWTSLRDNRLGWIAGNFLDRRPGLGWYGMEYQVIFDTQHFNRYPNEKEVVRQWRFSTYKPFQKAFFGKAINMTAGGIFQDSGYSITLSDTEDHDYIWGNNFEVTNTKGDSSKTNLPSYFAAHFKSIAEDPNGYFLVIPNESREGLTTQKVEPTVQFIYSKQIRHLSEDEIVFERCGYMWAVNKFGYFRWIKDGKEWKIVEPDGYYGHMLGYIPMFVAGGVWNTQGFYDSWLVDGKAIADDYIIIKSDEAMCAKQASHPFIIEASEDCPSCDGGKISYCYSCRNNADSCSCDDDTRQLSLIACGQCGGTGNISHNPGDRLIAPKEDMERALVQVINIPVDANEMHSKRAEMAELNLQKALHLDYIDQAQSAVAKAKDQMLRQLYMGNISNDYFDRLIPDTINAITSIRNISVTNGVIRPNPTEMVIVKPTQFEIKTSYDLLEEMKAGKESGIPMYLYNALSEDYVDKQFGGNDYLKRKTSLINQMDKLANKNAADISVMVLNNFATNRDGQFNLALPVILDRINRERGSDWFVNAPYDVIKAEVDQIFTTDFPIIPPIGPDFTDERINI